MNAMGVEKIISGGQTGVDQGAMEFALGVGIPSEGYCTKGRTSEDGHIPDRYLMIELDSPDYSARTYKNVEISDGTLILVIGSEMEQGTRYTVECCRKLKKPHIVVDMDADIIQSHDRILDWLDENQINSLNVAGNRESQDPGIYERTIEFLEDLFEVKKSGHLH